jgi:hypothetical protein
LRRLLALVVVKVTRFADPALKGMALSGLTIL